MSIYPNLNNRLCLYNISYAYLASILHIDEDAVSLKMQGDIPWKLYEAVHICRLLEVQDIKHLFLRLDTNT